MLTDVWNRLLTNNEVVDRQLNGTTSVRLNVGQTQHANKETTSKVPNAKAPSMNPRQGVLSSPNKVCNTTIAPPNQY